MATFQASAHGISCAKARWKARRLRCFSQEELLQRRPLLREALAHETSSTSSTSAILLRCADGYFFSTRQGWCQCARCPPSTFDLIVDVGELAAAGFVMVLAAFRWDALGKVEELLHLIFDSLQRLASRSQSRFRMRLAQNQLRDFLVLFVEAFGAKMVEDRSNGWLDFTVPRDVRAETLEKVLRREVFEERSHGRYAEVLLPALKDAPRVLDVGGGDGHMAQWWSLSGCEVHLLEVDPKLVAEAQQRLGQDRVTYHDGKSSWPFADGSFDVCLLLFVLHHIAEGVERTLREAARVAKRVLVLEDQPRSARSKDLLNLAVQVTAQHFRPFGQDPQVYMQHIRPDPVWRKLFEEAGLRCVNQVEIPGTLQHPVPHSFYELTSMSRKNGT